MLRQLILLVGTVILSTGICVADALQDTCDTGIPDTIIVGSVHVPGPLWPDSIGVPIYIWADEPIAAFSWGLRPLDNRIRVSSFSNVGSVFPSNMFIPTLVDTVNNQIGFGWADFTGFNPIDSPQGLVGTMYFEISPGISIGEAISVDSVSIGQAFKCSVTSDQTLGSCQMRSIYFQRSLVRTVEFGSITENVALHFRFDEPSGDRLYDYSGFKIDGEIVDHVERVVGVSGLAYDLGVYSSIRFGSALQQCETNYSVAFWIKTSLPVLSYQEIVRHNGSGIWVIGLDSASFYVGTVVLWYSNDYGWQQRWDQITFPHLQSSEWTHIAFVRSNYSISVYVDGDSVTSINTGGCPLYNSAMSEIGGGYKGAIDELRVFHYALTSSEILSEYHRVNYVACGDVDASRQINISDAVFIINYIFASGAEPPKPSSADVSCDGRIDITDAVYLINYFFASGSVPCSLCN